MKKVVGLILGLLPVAVSAECVPVPDCASIGYTETSCDGGSVKCPFDTTKLRCVPCDSSFRFSCSGENITSSIGNACNRKYVSCNCVVGATFVNGECICDNSCSAGNIYYSDGSCSSCLVENKTPIGVVVKDNELILAIDIVKIQWAPDGVAINGLSNDANMGNVNYDFAGKEHTAAIVAHYGETADNVAAVYCYNYEPSEMESTKHKWYLPAGGELYHYYKSDKLKQAMTLLNMPKEFMWASSIWGPTIAYAKGFFNDNLNASIGKTSTTINAGCFLEI